MRFDIETGVDYVSLATTTTGVSLFAGQFSRSAVSAHFTPAQARQLAQALLQAANEVDPVSYENPVTCPHCKL